jgi:hypothetical protein
MDISSLKKLLALEAIDLSLARPAFSQKPANAIILGEMTTEEAFLFVAADFCFQQSDIYRQNIGDYVSMHPDEFEDELQNIDEEVDDEEADYENDKEWRELNNQYHVWLEKYQICRMLLSHSIRARLSIFYSQSIFFLTGFLVAIDLDEDWEFIDADQDGEFNLFLN